jgi:hypothetical protein
MMSEPSSGPPPAPLWRRWMAAALHPILFALFPVFFLYARNLHGVQPGVLVVPTLTLVGVVLAILLPCFALIRRPEKTALAVSAGVLLFFSAAALSLSTRRRGGSTPRTTSPRMLRSGSG